MARASSSALRRVTRTRGLALAVAAALVALTGTATARGDTPAPAGEPPTTAATTAAEAAGDIVFSEPSGTFEGGIAVGLSTAIAGAEIHYTTDGEPPTAESPRYEGTPLDLTATTELRAAAFVDGAATGEPGTALYVARSLDATSDLPLLVMDAYGAGKPDREYVDVATLLMEPGSGEAALSAEPTLATRAGFHLRGQSSSMFEKAPYRLEFWDEEDDDLDHELLGMPADSDWVLRGPFSDKTLVHDAFAYGLGRDLGLAAPRFAFVELYLNVEDRPMTADDYQGVYMVAETIKISEDRLDLTELADTDLAEPEVTGGYVFSFEWQAAEEPTVPCPGGGADCWSDLELREPSELEPEQRSWLSDHLYGLHQALRGPDPADPATGYPAYLDVDSFVDHVIVNELTREMDSYVRSTYFHKDREGPIVAGPLWDYDLVLGTGGYFDNLNTAGWQYQQPRPGGSDWYALLMNEPSFVERVAARWTELRQGTLSDAQLNARIDALTQPLAASAARNFERWPNLTDPFVGPFITPTEPTWEGQVAYMRDWLERRAGWLDSSGWAPDAGRG